MDINQFIQGIRDTLTKQKPPTIQSVATQAIQGAVPISQVVTQTPQAKLVTDYLAGMLNPTQAQTQNPPLTNALQSLIPALQIPQRTEQATQNLSEMTNVLNEGAQAKRVTPNVLGQVLPMMMMTTSPLATRQYAKPMAPADVRDVLNAITEHDAVMKEPYSISQTGRLLKQEDSLRLFAKDYLGTEPAKTLPVEELKRALQDRAMFDTKMGAYAPKATVSQVPQTRYLKGEAGKFAGSTPSTTPSTGGEITLPEEQAMFKYPKLAKPTTDINKAGFLTTNGKLIETTTDHPGLLRNLGFEEGPKGQENLDSYLNRGGIRVVKETNGTIGIELHTAPSVEQLKTIQSLPANTKYNLDIWNGSWDKGLKVSKEVNKQGLLQEIKSSFGSGGEIGKGVKAATQKMIDDIKKIDLTGK